MWTEVLKEELVAGDIWPLWLARSLVPNGGVPVEVSGAFERGSSCIAVGDHLWGERWLRGADRYARHRDRSELLGNAIRRTRRDRQHRLGARVCCFFFGSRFNLYPA